MQSAKQSTDSHNSDIMDYDWRQKIQMPTAYRIGNSTVRLQTRFVAAVAVVGLLCLLFVYILIPKSTNSHFTNDIISHSDHHRTHVVDDKHPLSIPKETPNGLQYKIAIVSDLDRASKSKSKESTWISYLKLGYFTFDSTNNKASIDLEGSDSVVLSSTLSRGGRGMELSELVTFNGNIYSCDDRTGVVYKILNNSDAIPWVLLNDGDGETPKGFKCEWIAVKNDHMYVGGLGKVWTSEVGVVINHNPQFIKIISKSGEVEHVDWQFNYNAMRKKAGIEDPGYVIHESAVWSKIHKKWFFLPRRASTTKYNDKEDEKKGTNLLIKCSENFQDISITKIGEFSVPTHGFSSFKFVPNTLDNIIVALKSEEDGDIIASYIMVFTVGGQILFPEKKIANLKFEGIEFI